MIENGIQGFKIELVSGLYDLHDSMEKASFFEGVENPFHGRCSVIPRDATYYVMIPVRDHNVLVAARKFMRCMALVIDSDFNEIVGDKKQFNYNQFSRASEIAILWI